MIYDKIFKYVEHKKFFDKHDKVLIAVSGGVDSMNLLHFLHAYQKQLNIKIGLAHINHKQRLQSDEEETYILIDMTLRDLPFLRILINCHDPIINSDKIQFIKNLNHLDQQNVWNV